MTKNTYCAAVVRTPAGPDSIEMIDVPVVAPGRGQVRVAVAAAAVNPVDVALVEGLFHRRGLVHQRHFTGIGWDFSGTVLEVGAEVDLPVGSHVAGLVAGFDRDFGTYAEELVLPAADVAFVPDDLALTTAAAIPLNAIAALRAVDLLGDGQGRELLVTGAAGAVGSNVLALAPARGWRPTGLARATDEAYIRSLGAGVFGDNSVRYDAVVDTAVLQSEALAMVRDAGTYIGVQPGNGPAEERQIAVREVIAAPSGADLAPLLVAAAEGRLPVRTHSVVPLEQVAVALRATAKGGLRGKYVLVP